MTENPVFKWLDGPGCLILSGGNDKLSEIRSMALSRIISEGGIAYLSLDDDDNDDLIDDMGELGAPTGYLVNLMVEDDDSIRRELTESSFICIPGSYSTQAMYAALQGPGVEGMQAAYDRGAVIFAEGDAIALFGQLFADDEGVIINGLNWVENAFIVPAITSVAESQKAMDVLSVGEAKLAIGIDAGSALLLAEDGQLGMWGEGRVTVVLGSGKDS